MKKLKFGSILNIIIKLKRNLLGLKFQLDVKSGYYINIKEEQESKFSEEKIVIEISNKNPNFMSRQKTTDVPLHITYPYHIISYHIISMKGWKGINKIKLD